MRKYEVKGYVIVHGQNIKVIEQNVFAEKITDALIHCKIKLKRLFETEETNIELDNCIFDKNACAGIFVEATDLGNAHNWFQRMMRKIFFFKIVKR